MGITRYWRTIGLILTNTVPTNEHGPLRIIHGLNRVFQTRKKHVIF